MQLQTNYRTSLSGFLLILLDLSLFTPPVLCSVLMILFCKCFGSYLLHYDLLVLSFLEPNCFLLYCACILACSLESCVHSCLVLCPAHIIYICHPCIFVGHFVLPFGLKGIVLLILVLSLQVLQSLSLLCLPSFIMFCRICHCGQYHHAL